MEENARLQGLLDEYAARQVRDLEPKQVLESLREQGINSLEDLVASTLDEFRVGGTVARTSFVYEQFVYREKRSLEPKLLDDIESVISRAGGRS